jgi:hypothetical protein
MTSHEDPHKRDIGGNAADAFAPPAREPGLRRNKAIVGALVVLAIAIVVYVIALVLT